VAILSLFSVSGAPGVTSMTLALTLAWPRPVVLVDGDPAASKAVLAGWLQGRTPHDRSLVDLAIAHSHGELADALGAVMLELPGSARRWLIPGVQSPLQARTFDVLWPALLDVFVDLDGSGVDVIIDAGRLGMNHAPMRAIRTADVALLVTRTTLPAVVAAAAWVPVLSDLLEIADYSRLGLGLVGAGKPYGAWEVSKSLGNLPVLANLAWDPATAECFSLGKATGRGFESSPLVRSVRSAAESLAGIAASRRAALSQEQV